MNLNLVPENERMNVVARMFDLYYPLRLEPLVFQLAEQLSADYQGGGWTFYTFDETGFLMCPDTDQPFDVVCDNYYSGQVSAQAFGVIVSLYAFSLASFDAEHPSGQLCARLYHQLKDYILDQEHPEISSILAAID
jgi:hypothetical protein